MAYVATTFVFGETPSASKWNQLTGNDAAFADGTSTKNSTQDKVVASTTAKINQVMQRGFDTVQLSTTTSVSKAITLPTTYDDTAYSILVTLRGYKATAPANRLDITGNADNVIAIQAVTNSTSQFTVYLKPVTTDTVFIGFDWLTIGTKV